MKYIFLLLILIHTKVYSQVKNTTLGIFDVSSPVVATSKTSLLEADGFGKSFYKTDKLSNGKLKVIYYFDKPSVPNPLFISYAFQIEMLPSGDFAMDMDAAMPSTSLYIDTNTVQLSYTGDKIVLPNYPSENRTLMDVGGIFSVKRIPTNDILLTYDISLTNRKITLNGSITFNGKIYDVYVHTYSFVQKTFTRDNKLSFEWQDLVEETYLSGCGLVNQKRNGKVIPTNILGSKITNQTLISELLNIQ